MLFKSFLFFILSTAAFAETCPAVFDLKNNIFNGWQAYTLDNGEPLTLNELENLKKNIQRFDYAAWFEDAPEGEAQCYYTHAYIGKGQWGVYFAKKNLIPASITTTWREEGTGFKKCQLSREACLFN